jgi:hypothetical protein
MEKRSRRSPGWKLLEGFGMEGILHHEEGGYQLNFCRVNVLFMVNQYNYW